MKKHVLCGSKKKKNNSTVIVANKLITEELLGISMFF